MQFADVIINISHEKVDHSFSYRVPERLEGRLSVGMPVRVPFGSGNTARLGYVIDLKDEPSCDPSIRVKEIEDIETGKLPVEADLVRLAAWMRRTYGGTMIAALKTVLPVSARRRHLLQRHVILTLSEEEGRTLLAEYEQKHRTARARLLRALLEEPGHVLPYGPVTTKLRTTAQTLHQMENAGVLRISSEITYRDPVALRAAAGAEQAHTEPLVLSLEQQRIADEVLEDYDHGIRRTYLIHGITGSGKTEVYIRLIEGVVARGQQAIVLIPEISLTWQTLMRFWRHFGDRVSVMNSSLSEGERYDQAERARTGGLDVIIGPRSALFTPFPDTGLIIIDEEHEPTYKSENMPRYHARETAIQYASIVPHGASVILGSATPSLESAYRARTGAYRLFTLNRRLTGGTLPEVEIADLREELKSGNRSIFSGALQERLTQTLARGEQAMLFLNRRGLAGFVSCRACGHVFKCPHCDVSLTEHGGGRLVCHYCGYEEQAVRICPVCGSHYVSAFRAGTEMVERTLHSQYPGARILRMDADTTRRKGSFEEILTAFANREADVLIGTQMIVKGHDFPAVTLMGVLAADMSLSAGDYRASERTFQLLTQAAGRAGRGERPGHVVIQTYQPEHYAIRHAASQDYDAFYREEMGYRGMLLYPPYAHLLVIQFYAGEEKTGVRIANAVRATIERAGMMTDSWKEAPVVIGPAPGRISRIEDVFRYAVYVRHRDPEVLISLRQIIETSFHQETIGEGTGIQFDLDPMNGF